MSWKHFIRGGVPGIIRHRRKEKKKERREAKKANGGKTPSHFKLRGNNKSYFKGKPIEYEAGHKYSRLMQLRSMNDKQEHLLHKFEKYVKPDKYKDSPYRQHAMTQMAMATSPQYPTDFENAGSEYLRDKLHHKQPEYLQNLEGPLMRQYNEQVMPGIAERFEGLGALNSSAFQQTAAQAGRDLMERLGSLRAQYGMQNEQQNMESANMALTYGQVPFQQKMQRMNLANTVANQELVPQQYQNMFDQQARQRQMQQRSAVIATPPFSYMNVTPQQKGRGALASAIPGLAQGIGAGIGAAGMNAILPGSGAIAGPLIGAAAGSIAATPGATGPSGPM